MHASDWRSLRRGGSLIALYTVLLAAWVLVKPGGHTVFAAVRDAAIFCGALLGVLLASGWLPAWRGAGLSVPAPSTGSRSRTWAPRLLALGILCNVGGLVLWFLHTVLSRQAISFPWWNDVFYLSGYPFLLLGVLSIPARRYSLAVHARILLDSLMIITVMAMYSWFLVLGPTILQEHDSPFAAVVSTAYPLSDLVLMCSAILLAVRGVDVAFLAPVRLLVLALGIVAVSDSAFAYQMLHRTYVSAALVSVGWMAGYMLVGLSGGALRGAIAGSSGRIAAPSSAGHAWYALAPYALLPAVIALLAYAAQTHDDDLLGIGVYAGVALLLGLMLTRQILTLLDNARLYARLNIAYAAQGQNLAQRVAELEWLREISRRINAVRTLDEVLDVVYDGVRGGLGYDRLGIQLFDHERKLYEERRGTDEQGRKICPTDRILSLAEDSPIWRFPDVAAILGGAEFFHSTNMAAQCPPEQKDLLDGAPTYFLAVPMRSGAVVTGMIGVDNLHSGRGIAPEDAGPLLALANQVGTAIENARLLEREHAERAAVEAAQQRLTVLARASEMLSSSLDYAITLQGAAQLVIAHLADACMVDVIDEDGSFSQVAVSHRDPAKEEALRAVRLRYPPTPQGRHALTTVVRTGQSIIVPEVTDAWLQEHTRNAEHLEVMRAIGVESYMCVPLTAHGRTLGALTFLSARPQYRYGPDDVALAEDLARRGALAIDNARLYRQAQDAVRVRDHFLLTASHDLRTPLTSIMGRADLMHMRLDSTDLLDSSGPPDAVWLSAQVSALRDAAWRMTRTVEEITDAAHLQMGRQLDLHMSLVDISALVSAVALSLEAGRRLGTAPIVLDVPDGVIVQGDHARLERVLENVIGNAVKYSPAGTPVLVAVHSDGDWATIAVRDSGVGIPAEELPHIFTHFYRASTAMGIRGTGLGLAGTRTIVEQHGGRIAIESAVGQGTKVIVSLPRSLSSNETSAAR